MWARRVTIGFHRIGMILAFIVLVIGCGALLFGLYQWGEPVIKMPEFEVTDPDGGRIVVRYGTEPKVIGGQIKKRYEKREDQLTVAGLIEDEFHRIDAQRYGSPFIRVA